MVYNDEVKSHYFSNWGKFEELYFEKGSIQKIGTKLSILQFAPTKERNMWTYATCGMSSNTKSNLLELHIFSREKFDFLVELLTIIGHYHMTCETLGVGHTVNFGCPWHDGSNCTFGLISLPYLDGPTLEWLDFQMSPIRFLWLIPITAEEVAFKKKYGLEMLEAKFENAGFNYLDYTRKSLV